MAEISIKINDDLITSWAFLFACATPKYKDEFFKTLYANNKSIHYSCAISTKLKLDNKIDSLKDKLTLAEISDFRRYSIKANISLPLSLNQKSDIQRSKKIIEELQDGKLIKNHTNANSSQTVSNATGRKVFTIKLLECWIKVLEGSAAKKTLRLSFGELTAGEFKESEDANERSSTDTLELLNDKLKADADMDN